MARLIEKIKVFINNEENYPVLTVFAAGLYPFLHYYSSNLYIVGSLKQIAFLIGLCFVAPIFLIKISALFFKVKPLDKLNKYRLAVINSCVFISILGILIFHYNKREMLFGLGLASIAGLLLYKHIKKIIVLQFILALLSLVTFIPKLYFVVKQDNNDWLENSEILLNTKLKLKPNIFVIQPDGYINKSQINKPPYNFDNSEFEHFLDKNYFVNYPDYRSNYYSTLTSNSSMFAMKHHYYSNTNKKTLKTHNASNIIIGEQNTVLKILKKNNYNSYFFTDNSFFLIDRPKQAFDYSNIPENKVSFHTSEFYIKGIDIIDDFKKVLDTLSPKQNFVFIEKAIPGHISSRKSRSKGVTKERLNYLKKLERANIWLEELITSINNYDDDALIIIVADHGGYIGFEYANQVKDIRMNEMQAYSSFGCMLSIKYPKEMDHDNLSFKSNVNLFKNIFYSLTKEQAFLDSFEADSSFIPLTEGSSNEYYECIDTNGKVNYNKI